MGCSIIAPRRCSSPRLPPPGQTGTSPTTGGSRTRAMASLTGHGLRHLGTDPGSLKAYATRQSPRADGGGAPHLTKSDDDPISFTSVRRSAEGEPHVEDEVDGIS
jgi:hypothetical protein